MQYQYILDLLPYKSSFRFVDGISLLDQDKVVGYYTLRKDAFFYADHFPGFPVTPGAILTEIMAQIGLVTLGVYIITTQDSAAAPTGNKPPGDKPSGNKPPGDTPSGDAAEHPGTAAMPAVFPLLTSVETSFFKMVMPGEKVTVISNKLYFRFNKLKCRVEMQDAAGETIAKGVFAGMIRSTKQMINKV